MGKYSPGSRLPSEQQLARRFGVSRPTAGRALRDLQAAGIVERRSGSGTFMSDKAIPGKSAVARTLGLLIPGFESTGIFEATCGEIAARAKMNGYSVLWGGSSQPWLDTDTSFEHTEQVCGQFIQSGVAGVFFAPPERTSSDVNRRLTDRLRLAGVPVILLDRDVSDFPSRSDFDLVCTDNVAAGFILAEHMIKLGSKRIGFFTRPESLASVDARITGYREALARHKLDAPHEWVQAGDPADVSFVRSTVASLNLEGVICANDNIAAQLMRSLDLAGIQIPKDVRVAGFDDVPYAGLLRVPLTTVHQPGRELGETAFGAMVERIANPTATPRAYLLAPRIVVRESCGAYLPR